MKTWVFLFLVLVLLVNGCTGASSTVPKISVQDVWVRAAGSMGGASAETTPQPENMPMHGMNGAAYLTIKNTGGAVDKLLRVESDVAEAVELHKSEMVDGVMRMNPVEFIEVPAGETVELKPGGLHVMLIGLKQVLKPGDKIVLKLVFEFSGEIAVEAEIRAP